MKLHLGSEPVKLYIDGILCQGRLASLAPSYTLSPSNWVTETQVVTFASGTELEIVTLATSEARDFAILSDFEFNFNADVDELHMIWDNAHWGYNRVYPGEVLLADPNLEFYEFNYYEHQQEYDLIAGQSLLEAQYVREHGTYLGKLQFDINGQWKVY